MIAAETSAPKSYDQFGTIEVYDGGDKRIVLIEERHLQHHEMRYASGLHGCQVLREEDHSVRGWIEDKLLDRLAGREAED